MIPSQLSGDEPALQADASPLLQLRGVTAGFGDLTVLREVDLEVAPGTAVALLGPNGAGKTTLLRVAAGLMRPSAGTVSVRGADVTRQPVHERARRGVCLVPEGRGIFRSLTVRENLRLQVPPWRKGESIDEVLEIFPALSKRLSQVSGTMSGGEQQMVALARCYLSKPAVVLLDEVSMGLAPRIVDQIFTSLQALANTGVALLLVEQYVNRALEMVDRAYLLNRGRITYSGPAKDLDANDLMSHYLGADLELGHDAPDPASVPTPAPVSPHSGTPPLSAPVPPNGGAEA